MTTMVSAVQEPESVVGRDDVEASEASFVVSSGAELELSEGVTVVVVDCPFEREDKNAIAADGDALPVEGEG